jgi:acetyl esterase/lipase
MLPESSGVEILADVDDFWQWLRTGQADSLLSSLPTPLSLDIDRVITTGESAGGFLSVYLGLTFPDEIRAAVAQYPMFNQEAPPKDPSSSDDSAPTGGPPREVITEHLAKMNTSDIVSSDTSDSRFILGIAAVAHGNVLEFIERDSDVSPLHRDRLSQISRLDNTDTHLPRGGLVVLHGREDPVVPASLSERFVRVAREKLHGRQGADNIVLSIQTGEHGFDNPVHLEEGWLQEALKKAVSTWLE